MSEQDNKSPKQSAEAVRRDTHIETREIKANHYIFREREVGDLAFIIDSGTVEIVKNADGNEVVIGTLGKGAMFGEMALIDKVPRMASARAVERVTLTVVPRGLMNRKIEEIDPFVKGLLRVLSDHVRRMAKSMGGRAT